MTSRFQNFSVSKLFHSFGGFRFSFVQILGILIWFGIEKNLVSIKVSDSVSKIFGIGKSIGFGIGKIWYRKKVSDSVSVRFLVSSHTARRWSRWCSAIKTHNRMQLVENALQRFWKIYPRSIFRIRILSKSIVMFDREEFKNVLIHLSKGRCQKKVFFRTLS